jgi:hypothetical protein
MANWKSELANLGNCTVGQVEQGRYEKGNPHQGCKHFDDARNYYGPLHVMNWMKIQEERNALGWTVDAYVKACAERGIGTPEEHEEFRLKLSGIR